MANRNLTFGELSDRAVDNTMKNKEFMKFAAEKKYDGWSGGLSSSSSFSASSSSSSGLHQVG